MALAGLWLLAGLLAVRQAAAVLRLPPERRFTDLERWIGDNGVLHVKGSLYGTDGFTGTPFAGLVLTPLTKAAERGLGIGWTLGTLLLVAALGLVAARSLPEPVSRRTALLAAPAAIILAVLSLPVRNTFTLGQTSIIPVLLVLLACCLPRLARGPGTLVGLLAGLAAALQPAVLVFAALLWLTGRRRAAASTGVTFALCTAVAWLALPDDSWTYWVHHVAGAGLGEAPDGLANQSLHGLLLRLGLHGPAELALYGLLCVAVAVTGLRRAARYALDGQLLLATAVTGCVAVAVSPTAWQHQQLWILLAVVGRVGRRRADRLVWPVLVVLVMTLTSTVLMPDNPVLRPVGDNAPLLAALVAACAVPFLTRTSPLWRKPLPTPAAEPRPGGLPRFPWIPLRIPLLRFWKRPLSRPNVFLELMLIRIGYWVYSFIRAGAPGERSVAEAHGRQILGMEEFLHIDVEHRFNHFVAGVQRIADAMDYYYGTFHFLVPVSLLGYLYWRRPGTYRWARTALSLATLMALIGFWAYPLAPPRLMPGRGFIDTANGPQDFSDPDFGALTELSNQYAAMPSLHIGWSLWCGVVIAVVGPRTWLRWLGMLYPLMTFSVIVGTANHYVLDAVGGALVVALGFAVQYVLSGPGRQTFGKVPGARGESDPLSVTGETPDTDDTDTAEPARAKG
ncbi:bifunctional glycosyltransferase 87/phosphatase PAP2 family protein [Streptomyces sp. UNOC14_S4]|uniref:bifunctional glycosyltransferase 87/phosphatase PAP2 family protein n=1 Tax=Streptomyces sp. UNOC14_S4 TaxID=2872340 RepID=UPI001E2F688A|nr:bifunctional glycosyltransferase 87/phosphatase PAP2 family protein [Streptomyces sp. UNOC14_S4]MCC3769729.1 phosphatase PAP2 family protein [Streptomyces sp. UNOC14_S4]